MLDLFISHIRLFIALVGAITVLVKYWKPIVGFIKRKWQLRKRIKQVPNRLDKVDASLEEIKSFLGPNSGSSILDKVGFLIEDRNRQLERVSYPAFECDEEGVNILVSDAYRILVGSVQERDLSSQEWINVIVEEERKEHLKGFSDAVKNKRSFTRTTKFQNPNTHEYRGSWHIHAKRIPFGTKSIYSSVFLPEDSVARSIAVQNGWVIPAQEEDEMTTILENIKKLIGDGKSVAFPMFPPSQGEEIWIPIGEEKTEVMPRCFIWLIERKENETVLLLNCIGGITLPLHKHPCKESVEVLSGRMLDIKTNKEYKSGDIWEIEAGEAHGATFYNASVCIKMDKRLPLATKSNINMENIRLLIENV